MRKSFTFLAIMMVLFTSCKKEIKQVTEVTQVATPSIGVVYTIKPADWQTPDNKLSYYVSLQIPELADSIYDHGAVITYLSFQGTDYYEALPEEFDGISYGAIHSTGYVTIDYHAIDGGTVDPPTSNITAKVVLIPATLMKAHPGVNLRDYKEVEKVFLK